MTTPSVITPVVTMNEKDLSIELSSYVQSIEANLDHIYTNLKSKSDKNDYDEKFIGLYQYYDKRPSKFSSTLDNFNRDIFKIIHHKVINPDNAYILEIYTDRLKQMKEEPISSSEAAVIDITRLNEIGDKLKNIVDRKKLMSHLFYNHEFDSLEFFNKNIIHKK